MHTPIQLYLQCFRVRFIDLSKTAIDLFVFMFCEQGAVRFDKLLDEIIVRRLGVAPSSKMPFANFSSSYLNTNLCWIFGKNLPQATEAKCVTWLCFDFYFFKKIFLFLIFMSQSHQSFSNFVMQFLITFPRLNFTIHKISL